MKNFYEILGINNNASELEIKKAFKKRSKETHPDLNNSDDALFKEVKEAYDFLSDPVKRKDYDEFGIIDLDTVYRDYFNDYFYKDLSSYATPLLELIEIHFNNNRASEQGGLDHMIKLKAHLSLSISSFKKGSKTLSLIESQLLSIEQTIQKHKKNLYILDKCYEKIKADLV